MEKDSWGRGMEAVEEVALSLDLAAVPLAAAAAVREELTEEVASMNHDFPPLA
jgi:hypothetical protein